MCGLVGVAGNLYQKDLDVFQDLLWVDALRGMHNTGVVTINGDGSHELLKVEGNTAFLLAEPEYPSMLKQNNRVIIGHNRHATIGSTDWTNAHPYVYENVIGAHNGTLHGKSVSVLPDFKELGTDSAALYSAINDSSIEEVIPQLQGAWALVWYDRRAHTLNFLRNDQRPLSYAFSANGQTLYWASDSWMLRGVLARRDITISKQGVMLLTENKLITFDVPGGWGAFAMPTVTDLKGYSAPPFVKPAGQELAGLMDKWSAKDPTPTYNQRTPAEKAADALLRRSERENKPSATVVPHASPQETGNTAPWDESDIPPALLDTAFVLGAKAGAEGKSVSQNPFSKRTKQSTAWLRGRAHGLDQYMKNLAPSKKPLTIKGFNGEFLTESEWRNRTGSCCSWCDAPVEFGDPIQFYDRESFFCAPCVDGTDLTREYIAPMRA